MMNSDGEGNAGGSQGQFRLFMAAELSMLLYVFRVTGIKAVVRKLKSLRHFNSAHNLTLALFSESFL